MEKTSNNIADHVFVNIVNVVFGLLDLKCVAINRRKTNERSSRRGLFFSTCIAQNNNAAKTGREKINKSSQFSESRQQERTQCEQGQRLTMSRSYF